MEEIDNLDTFLKGIQAKKLYPENLRLLLSGKRIGTEGVKALATALQSGYCPQGLWLGLSRNQIGAEGAKVIAQALASGRCPQGLQLFLWHNLIGTEGAKAIARALTSGHCPQGLQLHLFNNQIGNEGAKVIVQALASGCCPQGLRLDLGGNYLGYEEAKTIAQALTSGYCPQGLWLDFMSHNPIHDDGVKAIAQALASGLCPEDLRLDYHFRNRIRFKILNEAWASYYNINKQVKFLKCMTLYHGHRQKNSIISLLPSEMLFEICRYILPTTPILAKMTEISTKVFQEQSAMLKLADSSRHAKQFDHVLATALVANTFTEKVEKIKTAINDYLHQEVRPHVNEKFMKLLSVALLHKFHLITGNEMRSITLSPIHHPDEPEGQPPLKKMRL